MSTTKTGLRVHQKRSENKENMPQSSKIPVASSVKKKKSVKLTKARPVPDFGKLHQQWQGKLERGKALTKKPCTVAHEFDITKSGTKMKRAKSKTELNGDLDLNVDLNLADDLNPDIDYGSDLDFAVDQAALNSIVTSKGVGQVTGRATIAATHSTKPSSSKRQIFKELPPDGRQLGDQDKTRKRKGSSLADLQQEEGIDFEVDSAALQSIVTNQGLSREDVFRGQPGVCSSIQRQTLAGPASFKTPVSAAPRTLNLMSARPSIYYQKSPFESKARMFRAHSEFQKRTLSKVSASTPAATPCVNRETPVKESNGQSPLGTGIRVVRRPDSIYVRTVSTRKGPCGDLDLGPTGTAPTPSAALGPPKRVPVPQSPSACRVPRGTTPKSKVKGGSRSDVTWADLLSPASAENQQNQEESCQKKDCLAMTLFRDDDTNYQTPHCVPLGVLEESPTCTSEGGSPLGVEDTEGHRQRLEEIREMERLLELEIAAMETTDTEPVKIPKNPLVANNSSVLQERPLVTESVAKAKSPSVSESVELQNSPSVIRNVISKECPVFESSEMGKFKPVQTETKTLFKQQHQQQNMALLDTGHKYAVTLSADIQQSDVFVRPQLSSLAERWQQQGAVSNNHSCQPGAVGSTQQPGQASVYQPQFLYSDQPAKQPCDSKMAMGIPCEETVSNTQGSGMYGSHGGHLALDDLNQSIRDSEEQFEELETCARMLQQSARQSGTGGGSKSAKYIWKQLEMVKKQQEELLKFQQQLQHMLAVQQHQQSQQLQLSTASQQLPIPGQHPTTQQQQQYFEQLPRLNQQISGQPQQGVITLQYQQRQFPQHGSQQQMQHQSLLQQSQHQQQQSTVHQHQQPSSTNLQSVHHNFMYSQEQQKVGRTHTQQYPFQPSVDENQCFIQHNEKQIASQVLATGGDAAKTAHVELNPGELTVGQRPLIQTANSAFTGLDLMNNLLHSTLHYTVNSTLTDR
ncbi:uncharacterized protein LOC106154772 [Lingula anatina]|uniref:Uncharacterized protein LOC106154772 n=1 Tax=Lingula anatina TaxID=7574 RepID=A0A1S3HI82_LINAN|nr:uncharacterized protein LOC106154772 [Lingula anatina]|eukprot:XP_013384704.2 uncharacterized protein LOC106154772 [Lingula anatina]